jgi:tetratricopeptide (TPR) repeat protein
MREAAKMFMETAATRAGAGARAEEDARAAGPRGGTDPGLCADMAGLVARLRRSGDEAAFSAAAAAALCSLFCDAGPELPPLVAKAADAAGDVLGPAHPVTLWLLAVSGEALLSVNRDDEGYRRLAEGADSVTEKPGATSRELAEACLDLARCRLALGEHVPALCYYAEALEVFEDTDSRGAPCPGEARPGLPPGRPGRDRLLARYLLAELLLQLNDPRAAAGVLAPCLDSLTRLPPAPDGTGILPWPAALSGMALYVAGMAAEGNGDDDGAVTLLRLALDNLGPSPRFPGCPKDVLGELRTLLERRGDAGSLREAALLSEREAERLAGLDGPDSPGVLKALFLAARHHEGAGDAEAALALHRKVLAARKRLLGPMAEETRQSRAEIRRINGKRR